jgi:hypothetical protein
MGAHCHVSEADGSLRLNKQGRPTIRTLLFPVKQVTLLDTWNVIGLRGTGSDRLCRSQLEQETAGASHHRMYALHQATPSNSMRTLHVTPTPRNRGSSGPDLAMSSTTVFELTT